MSDLPSGFPPPAGSGESLDSAILHLLMDTIPDRIYFKDLASRFVRVNSAHARWLGASAPGAVVGKTDRDFFSAEHAEAALAGEREIIRTGVPLLGRIERITKTDGSRAWGSTTKMPWRDPAGLIIGTFGLTRDVTAARETEEKLLEEANLLQTIIDHLPSRIFVKDTASRYLINNSAHLRWLGASGQEEARGRTTLDFFSGPRGAQAAEDDRRVLAGGAPILSQEKSDFGPAGSARWALTTKVPFHDLEGRIAGLVGISQDITERKRIEEELVRRSAEMEADLRMARQIQEAFFPRAYPVFPLAANAGDTRLAFAHRYVPAATLGGDFFDIIRLSDTRCGLLLCDVMGHGVRAGLLTALIRGAVEELGERAGDPAHVLGEINRGLLPIVEKTGQPVFATAFFGVIDLADETLAYANAGHPGPFLLRGATGTAERLTLANPEPAAGLVEGFAYSCRLTPYRSGDCWIGYTDGLFEACDPAGTMFGEERLLALVDKAGPGPIPALLDRMLREVEAFTGRKEFDDDICLLAAWRCVPPR